MTPTDDALRATLAQVKSRINAQLETHRFTSAACYMDVCNCDRCALFRDLLSLLDHLLPALVEDREGFCGCRDLRDGTGTECVTHEEQRVRLEQAIEDREALAARLAACERERQTFEVMLPPLHEKIAELKREKAQAEARVRELQDQCWRLMNEWREHGERFQRMGNKQNAIEGIAVTRCADELREVLTADAPPAPEESVRGRSTVGRGPLKPDVAGSTPALAANTAVSSRGQDAGLSSRKGGELGRLQTQRLRRLCGAVLLLVAVVSGGCRDDVSAFWLPHAVVGSPILAPKNVHIVHSNPQVEDVHATDESVGIRPKESRLRWYRNHLYFRWLQDYDAINRYAIVGWRGPFFAGWQPVVVGAHADISRWRFAKVLDRYGRHPLCAANDLPLLWTVNAQPRALVVLRQSNVSGQRSSRRVGTGLGRIGGLSRFVQGLVGDFSLLRGNPVQERSEDSDNDRRRHLNDRRNRRELAISLVFIGSIGLGYLAGYFLGDGKGILGSLFVGAAVGLILLGGWLCLP